jgi:hypothetical protein
MSSFFMQGFSKIVIFKFIFLKITIETILLYIYIFNKSN